MRYPFGKNWNLFVRFFVTDEKIAESKDQIEDWLGSEAVAGAKFLDCGCGSGIASAGAYQLGAKVTSFDFDFESKVATETIKKRIVLNQSDHRDREWVVVQGDLLDRRFCSKLGKFDIVYCWGVAHHTGDLVGAMERLSEFGCQNSLLWVAIYNDQGWKSKLWYEVKFLFNKNFLFRFVISFVLFWTHFLPLLAYSRVIKKTRPRGMNIFVDWLDWIGGFPFEVMASQSVCDFFKARGFVTDRIEVCGNRSGCNQFLFRKVKT